MGIIMEINSKGKKCFDRMIPNKQEIIFWKSHFDTEREKKEEKRD